MKIGDKILIYHMKWKNSEALKRAFPNRKSLPIVDAVVGVAEIVREAQVEEMNHGKVEVQIRAIRRITTRPKLRLNRLKDLVRKFPEEQPRKYVDQVCVQELGRNVYEEVLTALNR